MVVDDSVWKGVVDILRWVLDGALMVIAALTARLWRTKADREDLMRLRKDMTDADTKVILELNEKIEDAREERRREAAEDRRLMRELNEQTLKVWNDTDVAHDKLQIDTVRAEITGLAARVEDVKDDVAWIRDYLTNERSKT